MAKMSGNYKQDKAKHYMTNRKNQNLIQKTRNNKLPETSENDHTTKNYKIELQRDKNGAFSIVAPKAESEDDREKILQSYYKAFGTKDLYIAGSLLRNALNVLGKNDDYSDYDLNFIFNFLNEFQPKDPMEAMLAIQMMATHVASCKSFYRSTSQEQSLGSLNENISMATKLTRTYLAQMETLKKYRSKGEQKITVEHININDGGKAIIGTLNTQINNQV